MQLCVIMFRCRHTRERTALWVVCCELQHRGVKHEDATQPTTQGIRGYRLYTPLHNRLPKVSTIWQFMHKVAAI